MAKYDALGDFLSAQDRASVPMTFDEIEQVIGATLPPTAFRERAWWSNNPSNNVMTKVWLDAGYASEQVDMVGRKLVFRRLDVRPQGFAEGERAPIEPPEEAPQIRHPLFGLFKGMIHVAPGVDLTEPADPDWADIAEAWAEDWGRDATEDNGK